MSEQDIIWHTRLVRSKIFGGGYRCYVSSYKVEVLGMSPNNKNTYTDEGWFPTEDIFPPGKEMEAEQEAEKRTKFFLKGRYVVMIGDLYLCHESNCGWHHPMIFHARVFQKQDDAKKLYLKAKKNWKYWINLSIFKLKIVKL